jgi:acylphosphatase
VTRRYRVTGVVQGVGFRYFVRGLARRCCVEGWVRNAPDGSVEAVAAGERDSLDIFESELRRGPELSRVESVDVAEAPEEEISGFEVRR